MQTTKTILLAAAAIFAVPLAAQTPAPATGTAANPAAADPATVDPAAAAVAEAGSSALTDIIVTARRVEERQQEVPLSILAFSGSNLRERGITSVSELTQFTPGLSYSPDFGRQSERPVVRGISALRPEAPQPVSIFVDGVFVRDGALSLSLNDAARVEIVKGPQSALYGRASYGGAINYVTVRPGNDLSGTALLTVGSAGELNVFGAITLPLVKDVLSVRVRGTHYEWGGQWTNAQTGNKIGTESTDSIGGLLAWTPNDKFDADIGIDWSNDDDGLFNATIRPVPTIVNGVITATNGTTNLPNGSVCNGKTINIVGNNPVTGLPDPAFPATTTAKLNGWPCGAATFKTTTVKRNENDLANYTDPKTGISYGNIAGLEREVFRIYGTLNYNFDAGYTLTSITAYTNQNSNTGADQSYNATRYAPAFLGGASWLSYDRDHLDYFSQELRLISPQDRKFTWLGGLFYYDENSDGQTTGVIGTVTAPGPEALRPKSSGSSRNIAAFGAVQYRFNDHFKLSAELRYSEEKVAVLGTPLGIAKVTSGSCIAGQQCIIEGEETFPTWAPRFTAAYQVNRDMQFYGAIAKGTKSGGFNTTPGLSAADFTYDGETLWSYEIGYKAEFLDNRARFNIAFFLNDVDDLQLSNLALIVNPITGSPTTTTIVSNVGAAQTKGFEIEAAFALTKWLTLSGNYAYTHARATDGTDTTNGTVFGGNMSVDGFTLPRTPTNAATGSAIIDIPWEGTSLAIFGRADVIYASERYAAIQNLITADAYTHVNVSVGLAGANWRGSVWMKNLTDNNSSLNGFRYLDPSTFRRTAVDFLPRLKQWGFTMQYNF
ncbi:MAG: TonB-dependent receptor [Polymorphobacter sp.]